MVPCSSFATQAAIGIGFVLLVVTAFDGIAVDFGLSIGRSGSVPHTDYFSEDYRTARDRFRLTVAKVGGRLESLPLTAKGPDEDDLTIDIGWFGAERSSRVLLHSSGLHGVEAFAGSAIQLQQIEHLPAIAEGTAVVFVHVLNPYGMAWLRRCNENNVDLNRNFLADGEKYAGRPEGYDELYDFLNPSRLRSIDLCSLHAGWLVLRHGMPTLKKATVAGQYDYPEGLFFGGKELQQGAELYQGFLRRRLGTAEEVLAIDVHTGLGPFGEDTVLVSEADYDRFHKLTRDRVEPPSEDEGNVAYRIRGGLHEMVPLVLNGARVTFIGQEFGTYSPIRVLGALRKENVSYRNGQRDAGGPYKEALKIAFYPNDLQWEKNVLLRGRRLFEQVIGLLAEDEHPSLSQRTGAPNVANLT